MSKYSTYEAELEKHGRIIQPNRGASMLPLIRQNRDAMIIERPKGRLKRYDCPLYKRADGKYVLHRILKVRAGDYVICGDNCTKKEYGITDDDIIGVLVGVIRDGKVISTDSKRYRLYVHLWCDLFYVRVVLLSVKRLVMRVLSGIKRIFTKKEKDRSE